jgi:hypothetical protein
MKGGDKRGDAVTASFATYGGADKQYTFTTNPLQNIYLKNKQIYLDERVPKDTEKKTIEYTIASVKYKVIGEFADGMYPHGECDCYVNKQLLFKGIWRDNIPIYGCIYDETGKNIIYVGGMGGNYTDKQYGPNNFHALALEKSAQNKLTVIKPGLKQLHQLGMITDSRWFPTNTWSEFFSGSYTPYGTITIP